MKLEIFVSKRADLGEGPIWDYTTGALYWVDILNGVIYSEGKDGEKSFNVNGEVTSVSPAKDGNLMATINLSFYKIDIRDNKYAKVIDLTDEPQTNRFNDGKCDQRGRYWAGTMDKGEKLPVASLYVLESGTVRREMSGLTISNGLGWSPDSRYMYLIDTPTRKVWKFLFDIDKGKISQREIAVDFGDLPGVPDGMTVDSEGMIWVAHWGGGMISRWNPYSKKLLKTIAIPAKNVTSLTFGGKDMKTIFITTARHNMSKGELEAQPNAGSVFMLHSDVVGLPVNLCEV